MLLLFVVLIGAIAFYFYAYQSVRSTVNKRIALEAADSKMEELKKLRYTDLQGLNGLSENISIGNLAGSRNIYVYDRGTYKQVRIEVDWQEPGKSVQQRIPLDTYIAP